MSRDRPRTERTYDENRGRPEYEGEDRAAYQGSDRSTLPGFVPFGWPTVFGRGRDDEAYREGYDDEYDAEVSTYDRTEDGGSWLDEGLIGLTLVAGVVLFLFPEPATSGLGIVLISVGVVAWMADWAT